MSALLSFAIARTEKPPAAVHVCVSETALPLGSSADQREVKPSPQSNRKATLSWSGSVPEVENVNAESLRPVSGPLGTCGTFGDRLGRNSTMVIVRGDEESDVSPGLSRAIA
jgi:hypothetical protein